MSVRHRDIRMAMERLSLMKAKLEQADKGFQQVGYPSAAHAQAFVAYRLLDVVNEAADKFWALVEEDRVEKDSDTEDKKDVCPECGERTVVEGWSGCYCINRECGYRYCV